MPFERTWRIYAGDTDYSGRIYTPVVVDYVIKTIQDFRRSFGFSNQRFQSEAFIPPARNVTIDYVGSIETEDLLLIELDAHVGTTSITYHVHGEVDGTDVCHGTVTTVCVDKETGEPVSVPDEYREGIGRGLGDE